MSNKIIVIKLREVIKNVLLCIIGIIIIGFLIYLFIPKNNKSQALYKPGIYSSEIILHNNPVMVEVTVSTDKILKIDLLNMNSTQEVFYPLFERSIDELASKIIETQDTNILTSTDKMTTNSILIKAVNNALEQAKINF